MNNYVPSALLVCEVIQEAKKQKKKESKIKVLKDNESWALKDVLRGSYDMTVKWNIPDSKHLTRQISVKAVHQIFSN